MIRKTILFIIFFLGWYSFAFSKVEKIQYYAPFCKEMYLVWGVNGWQEPSVKPNGSFEKEGLLYTPMIKEGRFFSIEINLPEGTTINYVFWLKKSLFNILLDYWDVNATAGLKEYTTQVKENDVAVISPTANQIVIPEKFLFIALSPYLFLIVLLFLLLFSLYKKYKGKPQNISNPYLYILSVYLVLIFFHLLTRSDTAGLTWYAANHPIKSIAPLLQAATYDLIFLTGFVLFTVMLVRLSKGHTRITKWTIYVFNVLAFIFLLSSLLNRFAIHLIGRPFTYSWLYYSDFLANSLDLKLAVSANIDHDNIIQTILFLAAAVMSCVLVYKIIQTLFSSVKKTYLGISFLLLTLIVVKLAAFTKVSVKTDARKLSNPIVAFIASLEPFSGTSFLQELKTTGVSPFATKNKNILIPHFDSLFQSKQIKNVILLVMESTPAEYISCYNHQYNVTPFIDSLTKHAVVFDNVYAHAPSTNMSMFSLLCSVYPLISYQTITLKKPDIALPSLPQKLKQEGYQTGYFMSGDSRYQNADGFLKNRSFNVIEDFRNDFCGSSNFINLDYIGSNLSGTYDTCLAVRCMQWIEQQKQNPFFAMLWTYQTHYPYFSKQKEQLFCRDNQNLNRYLNALKDNDNAVKYMVQRLTALNLLNNTLIVITADHGEAFGRHEQTTHPLNLYEENVHIPCLFINPVFEKENVSSIGGISDIAPTILSVLHQPIPAEWQGEDMFSELRKKQAYFFTPFSDFRLGYREGNKKFLFNSITQKAEIYNLDIDKKEEHNLAVDEKIPKQVENNLAQWMQYQQKFIAPWLK